MIFLRFCHCGFRQISPLVRLMFPGGHLHVHPKIRSFFLLPIILLFSFLFFSFYLLFSSFFLLFFFLPIENPFNCEYSLLFHISYFLHAIAFHYIQRLFRLPCITLQGFLVFLAYIILAFQCLSFLSISSFPFFFLSLFLSLFYFYIPCIYGFPSVIRMLLSGQPGMDTLSFIDKLIIPESSSLSIHLEKILKDSTSSFFLTID